MLDDTAALHRRPAPLGQSLETIACLARNWNFESTPSSRQSVSLRISIPTQEKRGFSAILAAVRGGSVGRDAQSPATSRRGGVVSLSDDIPVPQCCRRRFAKLAAPAANEIGVAISVGLGVRIGSSKAEQGPLIVPGQWQT
jgi:hypothetical protein